MHQAASEAQHTALVAKAIEVANHMIEHMDVSVFLNTGAWGFVAAGDATGVHYPLNMILVAPQISAGAGIGYNWTTQIPPGVNPFTIETGSEGVGIALRFYADGSGRPRLIGVGLNFAAEVPIGGVSVNVEFGAWKKH